MGDGRRECKSVHTGIYYYYQKSEEKTSGLSITGLQQSLTFVIPEASSLCIVAKKLLDMNKSCLSTIACQADRHHLALSRAIFTASILISLLCICSEHLQGRRRSIY